MVSLLVYTSRTGNTRTFVDYLTNKLDIWVASDFDVDIRNYDHIILGTYTWSNGKIPQDMKEFLIKNRHNFKGKKIFIFGSGNSVYPRFCGAVDGIEKIVKDCGASVIGTFKFEQRFVEDNEPPYSIESLSKLIKEWSSSL